MREETGPGLGGEARVGPTPPGLLPLEEPGRQHGDVLGPLPQGRDRDLHHVEPVEQIEAELLALDALVQGLVRRADQPEVHVDRPRTADAVERALLDRLQDGRLGLGAQVADLVQEQGAPRGLLEESLVALGRAGERAGLVPEQLGFEQGLGE